MREKYDHLVSLVSQMRLKQKEFLKTRDANVLRESKALESKVDKEVEEYVEEQRGRSLFEDQPMNHAEEIRQSSDEELVQIIGKLQDIAAACPECHKKTGVERLRLWLSQKA